MTQMISGHALDFFSARLRRWFELAEREPAFTELMYDPDGSTVVDIGGELTLDTSSDLTDAAVYALAANAAVYADTEFSRDRPFLSIIVPPAYRVTFMRPPSTPRPLMALRRLTRARIPLSRYVESGVMTCDQAALLERCVAEARNVVVSGAVGSGKTTLLRALLELVPAGDRIVTIEDPAELHLLAPDGEGRRQHWLQLEASEALDMAALLRASLRLRPDRIIVGEVRGPDALEMVRSANVGHRGMMGTIHSHGAEEAIERLWTLVTEVQPNFKRKSVERAIDVVVQITGRGSARRIEEIWTK